MALLIYAIMSEKRKTKGKTRLTNMLKSGRELRVFSLEDQDLRQFCTEAKRYGVLYTILKDRDAYDGYTDIIVKAEDAGRVSRIIERFGLRTADVSALETDSAAQRSEDAANIVTKPVLTREEKTAGFIDSLISSEEIGRAHV